MDLEEQSKELRWLEPSEMQSHQRDLRFPLLFHWSNPTNKLFSKEPWVVFPHIEAMDEGCAA